MTGSAPPAVAVLAKCRCRALARKWRQSRTASTPEQPTKASPANRSQNPASSLAAAHQDASASRAGQLLVKKWVPASNMFRAPSVAAKSTVKGASSTWPQVTRAKCQSPWDCWCTFTWKKKSEWLCVSPNWRFMLALANFSSQEVSFHVDLTAPQCPSLSSKAARTTGVFPSGCWPPQFTCTRTSAAFVVSSPAWPKQKPPKCQDRLVWRVTVASSCPADLVKAFGLCPTAGCARIAASIPHRWKKAAMSWFWVRDVCTKEGAT
mmetsp:Transcript_57560/g.107889  ORF Transcript_57560/g.107889 Transcript_57560/m.107889 type:complete len:264 (+) Transcript_57560:340-1131(+)